MKFRQQISREKAQETQNQQQSADVQPRKSPTGMLTVRTFPNRSHQAISRRTHSVTLVPL